MLYAIGRQKTEFSFKKLYLYVLAYLIEPDSVCQNVSIIHMHAHFR